jgi:membrane protease YdiL (CAAX protease family)
LPPLLLAEPETPSWGFGEILASSAAFLVALEVIVTAASHYLGDGAKLVYWAVIEEFAAYLVMFAVLKALFFIQGQPLLRSLGWVRQPFGTVHLAAWGLLLFAAGVVLQIVLRMPDNSDTPFEKMLYSDHFSPFVLAVFGVTLGPVIEELLFRGLLQPVLVSAIGVFPGILTTSVLFAALHLQQNALIWQSGVIIGIAGFGFGVIRHITGSTRASSIAHVAYNALPFAITLIQGAQPIHR